MVVRAQPQASEAGAAKPARAAGGGPLRYLWQSVWNRGYDRRPMFRFSDWRAELVLRYDYDKSSVDSGSGGRVTDFDQHRFTERFRLRTQGYMYDPRLIRFNLGSTLGFYQELYTSVGEDGDNLGTLLGFDGQAVLFEGRPVSLEFIGNRTEDTVDREFSGTTEVLIENAGARVKLPKLPLASIFGYRHERLDEVTRLGGNKNGRQEVRSIASYHGDRVGARSDLKLDYEYGDFEDKGSSLLSYRAHDAVGSFRIFFGKYLEMDSLSRIRAFIRQGDFDNTQVNADQALRIDHTETLATAYDYTFSYTESGPNETTTHRGAVNLRHRLYGSLDSNLRAFGNYSEIDDGTTYMYGGLGQLRYRKNLPRDGTLTLGGRGSYQIDDRDLKSSELSVFDERHVVQGFERIILDEENVLRDTIVVTDATRTTIFEEGFDYEIVEIGASTAIQRIASGRFVEGETVLVSYRFAVDPSLKFSTLKTSMNFGVAYDWLFLFFDWRESNQDLISGDEGQFLDDITDQIAGVRFRVPLRNAELTLRGEFRARDSTQIEYLSPRLAQSLSYRPRRTLTVNLDLGQSYFDYSRPNRTSTNILNRLRFRWRPRRNVDGEIFAGYLYLRDSEVPDETTVDAGVRFHIRLSRLRISPSFLATHRDVSGSESNNYRVRLELARDLF